MASKVNPRAFPPYALGDDLNQPLRQQLAIIRDEITALQEGESSGVGKAFWFASLSGDVGSDWTVLATSGGGMTGDAATATPGGGGLVLSVDAVVSVKLWCLFSSPGGSSEVIAVQIADSEGTVQRGQEQLPSGVSMASAVYDGWLAAGATICAVASTGTVAKPSVVVDPSSYITVSIVPV